MVAQEANRRYDELHAAKPYHDGSFERWAAERSPEFPFHYRDGVRLWVADSDLSPDDDFLGLTRSTEVTPEALDRLMPS